MSEPPSQQPDLNDAVVFNRSYWEFATMINAELLDEKVPWHITAIKSKSQMSEVQDLSLLLVVINHVYSVMYKCLLETTVKFSDEEYSMILAADSKSTNYIQLLFLLRDVLISWGVLLYDDNGQEIHAGKYLLTAQDHDRSSDSLFELIRSLTIRDSQSSRLATRAIVRWIKTLLNGVEGYVPPTPFS